MKNLPPRPDWPYRAWPQGELPADMLPALRVRLAVDPTARMRICDVDVPIAGGLDWFLGIDSAGGHAVDAAVRERTGLGR